jgi:glycerophosphoryl diester phosphodiesterase
VGHDRVQALTKHVDGDLSSASGTARQDDVFEAPIVIAHRGASGYLPEHTLEAKALAFGLGADYLEQDVVATRDRELVVLHDLHLDDVTNVANVFPGRSRTDGRHYVVDFDLAELRRLRVSERRQPGGAAARFPGRFPVNTGAFRIATLDEELDLIAGLNRSTGRAVGIYPEVKSPRWHHEHGVDLGAMLLAKLEARGYREAQSRAYVQCFDAAELRRMRTELGCRLKLVQLVGPEQEYGSLLDEDGLRRVAAYADALGPGYEQLIAGGESPTPEPRPAQLAEAARRAGLRLHPYTFRADMLPPFAASLDRLLDFFFVSIRVDGVFCDHPDVAVRVRDAVIGSAR